jgi:hypothetical protein
MLNLKHIIMKRIISSIALVFLLVGQSAMANNNDKHLLTKPNKQTIRVALLLDTSNSMDGLINQAKAQLWEIVNELSYARCKSERPNLKIALYEYGNDALSAQEGYMRQVIGFSSDLDEISEKLFSLTTNGGSEFCGQVIQTSLKQLAWGTNPDDLKLVFIAGNEPFTQGKVNYKDATTNAKEKDIIVNTIYCGNYQQGVQSMWKDGADRSNGEYMTLDHNKTIVHIATPYDDIIIQLNKKLNGTYIPYGNKGYAKMALQSEQDSNAAQLDEVVEVKRAVTKSSALYNNSSWDLVDAENDANFSYDKLKKEQLPAELQNKSLAEIKIHVKQKASDRLKVQQEIQELNQKRKAYIAQENKNQAVESNLENAIINAIKKQAKRKNYEW